MSNGYCPECDGEVGFKGPPRKGHKVTCPSCGTELKVVQASPIELDWADGDWEANGFDPLDDGDEDDDDGGTDFD
jgi:hypothetical protein